MTAKRSEIDGLFNTKTCNTPPTPRPRQGPDTHGRPWRGGVGVAVNERAPMNPIADVIKQTAWYDEDPERPQRVILDEASEAAMRNLERDRPKLAALFRRVIEELNNETPEQRRETARRAAEAERSLRETRRAKRRDDAGATRRADPSGDFLRESEAKPELLAEIVARHIASLYRTSPNVGATGRIIRRYGPSKVSRATVALLQEGCDKSVRSVWGLLDKRASAA